MNTMNDLLGAADRKTLLLSHKRFTKVLFFSPSHPVTLGTVLCRKVLQSSGSTVRSRRGRPFPDKRKRSVTLCCEPSTNHLLVHQQRTFQPFLVVNFPSNNKDLGGTLVCGCEKLRRVSWSLCVEELRQALERSEFNGHSRTEISFIFVCVHFLDARVSK